MRRALMRSRVTLKHLQLSNIFGYSNSKGHEYDLYDAFIVFSSNPYYYQPCYTPPTCRKQMYLSSLHSCTSRHQPTIQLNPFHQQSRKPAVSTAASTPVESRKKRKPNHNSVTLIVQNKVFLLGQQRLVYAARSKYPAPLAM